VTQHEVRDHAQIDMVMSSILQVQNANGHILDQITLLLNRVSALESQNVECIRRFAVCDQALHANEAAIVPCADAVADLKHSVADTTARLNNLIQHWQSFEETHEDVNLVSRVSQESQPM